MKKLFASAVMLLGMGFPVLVSSMSLAADLSVPAPRATPVYTKAPPIEPAYNWSGFYAGAHGGYGKDPVSATFDPGIFTNTLADNVHPLAGTSSAFGLSTAPKGGFGGFQLGYNWQAPGARWVVGLETDASFGSVRGEDAKPFKLVGDDNGDNGPTFTGVARLRRTVDDFGTVRGRLGFAADTLLLYGTGGFAWARTTTRFGVDSLVFQDTTGLSATQIAALSSQSASSKDSHFGYAVGGGAEWAFTPKWSLKAEYVYLNFSNGGNATLVIPGGVAHAGNFDMHTAKGGINYHF